MTDRSDRAGGDGLRALVARFPEINLGNYNDYDVEALNNWGLEIVAALATPPSGNAGEGADIDALAEIWRICDRAGEYSKSRLATAIAQIVEARTKARSAAPPQPAPDAVREALAPPVKLMEMVDYSKGYKEKAEPMWRVEVSGVTADFPTESWANNFRSAILALSLSPAPVQSGGTEAPAQSSLCLRYINGDAELVCKCVNGKSPEVVDMEWRPPTCKAVASHDGERP